VEAPGFFVLHPPINVWRNDHQRSKAMMMTRRTLLSGLSMTVALTAQSKAAPTFKPIPTQFIAALGNPLANNGTGSENWGLWTLDPGPRGVRLGNFSQLVANAGVAPSQWKFDAGSWWLEEHGLIMEQPDSKLSPGRYMVTGDRIVQTTLTIHEKDASGSQRWELADGAVLYDITHLRCRSARYTADATGKPCTPSSVNQDYFPIDPTQAMPEVSGCTKLDFAVLFVVGVEE
jgi:hypothetical protein